MPVEGLLLAPRAGPLPRADGDLRSSLEGTEEPRGLLERRREVGVREEHDLAPRREHARAHGERLPAVSVRDDLDVLPRALELLHDRERRVAAPVVHEDELDRTARRLAQEALDAAERRAQPLGLVVGRYDERERVRGQGIVTSGATTGALPAWAGFLLPSRGVRERVVSERKSPRAVSVER